jgi:lysophospholipase L1-like esterase
MTEENNLQPLRLLMLGDSYTAGEGVDADKSWPFQLAGRLETESNPECQVNVIAQTGWTTADLLKGIYRSSVQGPYDLVFVQIGVNNQYQMLPIRTYQAEFREILSLAVEFTGRDPQRVIVLSIPDWGVTPHAEGLNPKNIAAQINRYNALNLLEASKAQVGYVDVTPLSREAAANPALLADDGLHPSGLMYATWIEEMLPLVQEGLGD